MSAKRQSSAVTTPGRAGRPRRCSEILNNSTSRTEGHHAMDGTSFAEQQYSCKRPFAEVAKAPDDPRRGISARAGRGGAWGIPARGPASSGGEAANLTLSGQIWRHPRPRSALSRPGRATSRIWRACRWGGAGQKGAYWTSRLQPAMCLPRLRQRRHNRRKGAETLGFQNPTSGRHVQYLQGHQPAPA